MDQQPKTRKAAPWLFLGQTTSLCEECLQLVPAKILEQDQQVWYHKRCPEHGLQKTLISSDAAWYHRSRQFIRPGDRPLTAQTSISRGCPHDCGLCPDHEQHSCVALIEINEHCNLACPTCFAGSSPARSKHLDLATIEAMLDTLVASEGEADVLQISGGEPTLHPQILDILRLAKTRPIKHLMLNTNGIRLAEDADFVRQLAALKPGFEIYLQFDSLRGEALKTLRGRDLLTIRRQALEHLEEHGLSTTLVVTVKKGVNDQEPGDIIDFAAGYRCIRGVTFQPVADTGRNVGFDKQRDRVLHSEIRQAIISRSRIFGEQDIIPLPCNPESIAIGYGLRTDTGITPVTALLPEQSLLAEAPGTVSFESSPQLRQQLPELFSLSSGEANSAERLGSLLCCLPTVALPEQLSYENVFRVAIVQFLDRYNFCLGAVKRSCIHIVTADRRIIPLDTYNLFYREPAGQ